MGCKSIHWGIDNVDQMNTTKLLVADHLKDQIPEFIEKREIKPRFGASKLMHIAKEDNKQYLYYFADDVNAITQMDYCGKGFCFWPQLTEFKVLDEQYPDSLFILMHRNIEKHIASINNWQHLREKLERWNLPYLPQGTGKTDAELKNCINSHYKNVTKYFNSHARDRFLQYHIENDDVEKLKKFLKCNGNYTLSHVHDTSARQKHN